MVVFCLGKNLLFKSILGRCDLHGGVTFRPKYIAFRCVTFLLSLLDFRVSHFEVKIQIPGKWNYLKNPSPKILFVLGSYEYLERLEGKIRKCLFFYVKIL